MQAAPSLIRIRHPALDDRALARLRKALDAAMRLDVLRPLEAGFDYAYIEAVVDAQRTVAAIRDALPDADVARLAPIMTLQGASAGVRAPYHYIVETDVEPGLEGDFNAWYDNEHLRGLAGVDGTVHAARYRNLDEGPRYHACYDLARLDAYGSPAWLAVRATPWSDRVRPAFCNTRRTMFRRRPVA